MIGQYKY